MAVPETAVLHTVANLDTLVAVIECQQPEADLYRCGIQHILSPVYRSHFYNHKYTMKSLAYWRHYWGEGIGEIS